MLTNLILFQEKQPFERIEVSRDQALEIFSENKFKASKLSYVLCDSVCSISLFIIEYF